MLKQWKTYRTLYIYTHILIIIRLNLNIWKCYFCYFIFYQTKTISFRLPCSRADLGSERTLRHKRQQSRVANLATISIFGELADSSCSFLFKKAPRDKSNRCSSRNVFWCCRLPRWHQGGLLVGFLADLRQLQWVVFHQVMVQIELSASVFMLCFANSGICLSVRSSSCTSLYSGRQRSKSQEVMDHDPDRKRWS